MSRGHDLTTATIHAPRGPVTVGVRVCWIRCDGCGVGLAVPTRETDHGDDQCAALAEDHGWEGDRCPDCRAEWGDEEPVP